MTDKPTYEELERRIQELEQAEAKRKRMAEALQRSEALLNATEQLSKVGGWEWNIEKQSMFWTNEVYRIHEFEPSEFTQSSTEHIERGVECYDIEDRPVIMAAFRRCAEKGQAYDLEFPFTTAMGRRIWIRTVAKPVLDGDRVVRVVGNIMDITDRRQAEEALRESEEHLQSVFRAAPTGIGVVVDRVLKQANKRMCKMVGYSEEELIGQNARMLYPSDEEYEFVGREKYEQIRNYGTGTVETRFKRKDGRIIDVLLSSTPIVLGDLSKGVTFTALDVTDRKQAEEALLKERDKARSYLDIAGVIIVILNVDQTVALINKKGCEILGFEESEVIGTKWFDNFIPERDRERTRTGFFLLVAGNIEPVEYFENYVLAKDNTEKLIAWHNTVLRDEKGNIVATLSSGEDITKSKQSKDALRESEEKFRSFSEQALVGTYLIQDNIFKYVNPKFAEIFGYTVEQCLNDMPFHDLVHSDDIARVEEQVHRRLSGETKSVNYTFRGIKKTGEIIHVEIYGSSIILNGKPAAIGTMLDTTVRKQTEEALAESESKYRSMMEAMKDPVYICSPDFRVEYMNPAMIRRTGRDGTGEHCFKALHDLDEKCSWCTHHVIQQLKCLEIGGEH
jgi:PAS domain S-box-containing protein